MKQKRCSKQSHTSCAASSAVVAALAHLLDRKGRSGGLADRVAGENGNGIFEAARHASEMGHSSIQMHDSWPLHMESSCPAPHQ